MTVKDVIATALALPSGAVFHSCALQVNPFEYLTKYRGQVSHDNSATHALKITNRADDLGVSVLAITNHNDASGVMEFRAAAQGRGVQIFPGFELTSHEGVHVLCIYPQGIRLGPQAGVRGVKQATHAELVAIAWEGGFLDGAAIHFNPNLNVLIGGRGTGKSTVVESIRSALGLDAVGDDARKQHEGIVRQVLKSGTKISLLVRTHRPAAREYRIERTIPNPPLVRDECGEISTLAPRDLLPRIEVFGQHEISELTKSREKLTRLLDRFVGHDDSLARRKTDLRRELERNRRSLLEAETETRKIGERLAALPRLEETLERYREAGLEDRLREQSLLIREERLLNSLPERLAPFRECLEVLRREVPIDRVFLSAKALEALPGKEVLDRLNGVLAELDHALAGITKEMETALQQADDRIGTVRAEWQTRKVALRLRPALSSRHSTSYGGASRLRSGSITAASGWNVGTIPSRRFERRS